MSTPGALERFARAHVGAAAVTVGVDVWYLVRVSNEGPGITRARVIYNALFLAVTAACSLAGTVARARPVRVICTTFASTAMILIGNGARATVGVPLFVAGLVTLPSTGEEIFDARPWGALLALGAAIVCIWSFFLVPGTSARV